MNCPACGVAKTDDKCFECFELNRLGIPTFAGVGADDSTMNGSSLPAPASANTPLQAWENKVHDVLNWASPTSPPLPPSNDSEPIEEVLEPRDYEWLNKQVKEWY